MRRVVLRLLPRRLGILAALLAFAAAGCIAKPGVEFPHLAASDRDMRGPQTVRHGAEGSTSTRRGFFWNASSRQRAQAPARPARPGAALVSESGDGVTLNLVEAPIADAAKAVLGDILGVNYVIDGRVAGSVTVQTTSPVTKTALLGVFDAVLSSQGAGMVVEGDLHKIVPANQVASSGAQLRVRGDGRPLGPGTSIYAVPMTHVAASEMRELLASVSPENAILHAGGPGNVLIVAGTRAEIIAMLEIVDVFDVDEMRGMSFAMFPVQAADPQAVASELDTLFGNSSDSGYRSVIRFVPNRRLRAVLAMSANPDYLRQADEMLLHLDAMSQASARELFSYKARNRPAAELADLLVQIYGAASGALADDRNDRGLVASPAQSEDAGATARSPALADTSGADSPIPAGFTADEGARERPGSFAAQATGTLGPPVSVVADNANRMLLITATRDEYTRIAGILDRIDLPPDQVLLEATIAEVTLNDELRYGLRWFFQDGEKRRQFTFTDLLVGAVAPTFPGFSYFFNGINTQIALDALSAVTDVNIVSSPTLTVLDGRRAVLQVGDEVPIITQQVTGVENPNAPLVNSVNYRNTGIILNIVPTIQERGRVVLEIEQEVSEVGATTSSTINSPTIQQRRIATTVIVDDGESLAIGGLMQDRSSRGRDQVPILGEIPVVGNLFKSKRDTVRRTELLIVMTPRIVRDTNQVRQIADEFRGKLNFSLRHQRQKGPTLVEQLDRLQR